MTEVKKKQKNNFILYSFGVGIFTAVAMGSLLFNLLNYRILPAKKMVGTDESRRPTLISAANAQEIYPEFICSCCGKPLDPNKICCGDMKQKIAYIDDQVAAGLSSEEIIMNAAREFGLNSVAKKETQTKIKNLLIAQAPANAPKIIFETEAIDLGQVSQAQGVVSIDFQFTNKGKSDLIIDKLNTSCGCTSASIVYESQEGPQFTMPGHGQDNPTDWSVAIAPGDQAQLRIYFDPNAHGPQEKDVLNVTRSISVFSNDPIEFEKKVKIELTQIP